MRSSSAAAPGASKKKVKIAHRHFVNNSYLLPGLRSHEHLKGGLQEKRGCLPWARAREMRRACLDGEMESLKHLNASCCWFTPCAHPGSDRPCWCGAVGAGPVPPHRAGRGNCGVHDSSPIWGSRFLEERGCSERAGRCRKCHGNPVGRVVLFAICIADLPSWGWGVSTGGSTAWQAERAGSVPQGEGAALPDLQHLPLLSHVFQIVLRNVVVLKLGNKLSL